MKRKVAIASVVLVYLTLATVVALWVAPFLHSTGGGWFYSIWFGSAFVVVGVWFPLFVGGRLFLYVKKTRSAALVAPKQGNETGPGRPST